MKFRPSRGLVRRLLAPLVLLWARTWRVRRSHAEHKMAFFASPGARLVILWHETLLPLLLTHRHHGITVIVSEARDGRYLADFAERIGYGAVGGSSHRGRVKAMRGAVRVLEASGVMAVTPDGPRGPRRVLKPGALQALQTAGGIVMPVFASARPAIRLRSWDRFLVPLPFAKVRVAYGEPFAVAPGKDGLDQAVARCLTSLEILEQEVRWPDAA